MLFPTLLETRNQIMRQMHAKLRNRFMPPRLGRTRGRDLAQPWTANKQAWPPCLQDFNTEATEVLGALRVESW